MAETKITTVFFDLFLADQNKTRDELTQALHTLKTTFKGNVIGKAGDNYLTLELRMSELKKNSKRLSCGIVILTSAGSIKGSRGEVTAGVTVYEYGPGKTLSVKGILPSLFGSFGYGPAEEIISNIRNHYNEIKTLRS